MSYTQAVFFPCVAFPRHWILWQNLKGKLICKNKTSRSKDH